MLSTVTDRKRENCSYFVKPVVFAGLSQRILHNVGRHQFYSVVSGLTTVLGRIKVSCQRKHFTFLVQ